MNDYLARIFNDNLEKIFVVAILFFALLFVIIIVYRDDNPKTYCIDNVQYLRFSSHAVTVAYTSDGKPKHCSN